MPATATAGSKSRVHTALTPRRFYGAMSVLILVTVVVGFSRTYFLRSYFDNSGLILTPLYPALHIHAIVNLSWLLLFFAQISLIATGRRELHKKLGVAGAILAPLVVIFGVIVAITDARRGPRPLPFLPLTLGDMVIFAALTAAGLKFRRQPEVHKRLMLLGTVGTLLPAAIKRLPYVLQHDNRAMVLIALALAAAPVYEYVSRRRVSALNVWGGLLIYLSIPARLALGRTELWHRFAVWLVR